MKTCLVTTLIVTVHDYFYFVWLMIPPQNARVNIVNLQALVNWVKKLAYFLHILLSLSLFLLTCCSFCTHTLKPWSWWLVAAQETLLEVGLKCNNSLQGWVYITVLQGLLVCNMMLVLLGLIAWSSINFNWQLTNRLSHRTIGCCVTRWWLDNNAEFTYSYRLRSLMQLNPWQLYIVQSKFWVV